MSALHNRYERALENYIIQNVELYYTNILGDVKEGYPTARSLGGIFGDDLSNIIQHFEKNVVDTYGGYNNINMLDFIEYILKELTGERLISTKSVRSKYKTALQDNEYLRQLIVYLGFRYLELAYKKRSLKSENAFRMIKNWYLLKQAQDGIGKIIGRGVRNGLDSNDKNEFDRCTMSVMKQVLELSKESFVKSEYDIYLEFKDAIESGILQMRDQITIEYKEAI
jgi:hypothetical protein